MIDFYLNNQKVDVLIAPRLSTTEDATLDSASIVLKANSNPNPIAPMQVFKIVVDNSETLLFYTATDEVSVFSTSPLTYQHRLTITQNIRALSKRLMRNTVFSQPSQINRESYGAFGYGLRKNFESKPISVYSMNNYNEQNWVEPLIISTREQISSAYYQIQGQFFIAIDSTDPVGKGCTHIKNANPFDYVRTTFEQGHSVIKFKIYKVDKPTTFDIITLRENDYKSSPIYDLGLTNFIKRNGAGKYAIDLGDLELIHNPDEPVLNSQHPFYFTIQIKISTDIYYYNAYDVLDIINKQYMQQDFQYQKEPLYYLPSSGELYDLLKNTIAPNFVFTQSTYFEAVAEVFKLFDAIFTLDEYKVLGIEFLNRTDRTEINAQIVGRTTGIGEDRYNNGFVSFYQNALLTDKFPANTGNAISYVRARSMSLGVPNKENAFAFITPHKIDMVNKLYIHITGVYTVPFVWGGELGLVVCKNPDVDLDISHFVFETSIWTLLSPNTDFPSQNNYSVLQQNNTLSYNRGANQINLSSLYNDYLSREYFTLWNVIISAMHREFGLIGQDLGKVFEPLQPEYLKWDQVFMSIDYLASVDGKFKVESLTNKYQGEFLVNQNSGAIDLNKLGLNILGLSYKLGEPTLAMNQKSTTWENAIKKGQLYIDDNGDRWVANVCNYTFFNTHIETNVQFVKNFNGLAQRIKVNREKRLSNISGNLAVKSEDIYTEYLYVSSTPIYELAENIVLTSENLGPLAYPITNTFGNYYLTNIEFASMVIYATESTFKRVYLPMFKYGSGNAICFEMGFDSPISAGYKTTVQTGWWGENQYFSSVVKYTDDNGFFINDKCSIDFHSASSLITPDFPDLSNVSLLKMATLSGFKYYKKPNEIFGLNYELVCLPLAERVHTDFIGQKFITENGLIKGKNKAKFYLYIDSDRDYDILDQKGKGVRFMIKNVDCLPSSNNKFMLSFKHGVLNQNATHWAICDENANIYFASNTPKSIGDKETIIYFIPRHNRL